jgi:hypothetical protein
MKAYKFFTLVGICLFMVACSNTKPDYKVKVRTDFRSTSNFSHYKTFAWYNKITGNKAVYQIMHDRITETIIQQLQENGFQKVTTPPDFYVNYSVTSEDGVDIESYNTYSGYIDGFTYNRYGYGYVGSGVAVGNVRLEEHTNFSTKVYKRGTLIIDIIDAKSGKMMWRGLGSKRIPENPDAAAIDKLVSEVVGKILSNFPPK